MLFLFSSLSLFSVEMYYPSHLFKDYIPKLVYGYNKNANILLKIANLSSPLILCLATESEMKKLNKLSSILSYCDSKTKITDIQFEFPTNGTVNFTIPSKSILTALFLSCEPLYKFNLSMNIINGKNHLDYRLQDAMTCSLVFSIILYFTTAVIFVYFLISLLKHRIKFDRYLIFLIISLLIASTHFLISFIICNNEKDYEFIELGTAMIFLDFFSAAFVCIIFCLLNYSRYIDIYLLFHDDSNILCSVQSISLIYLVLLVINILFITLSNDVHGCFLVLCMNLIIVVYNCMFPSNFTLVRLASLLSICLNFLNSIKNVLLMTKSVLFSIGLFFKFFVMDSILLMIIVVLVLVDYFGFYCKNNVKKLGFIEKSNEIENYPDDTQRN